MIDERDEEFLRHMVDAAKRVKAYIGTAAEAEFMAAPMMQDAVIRNIEILGEAANRLSAAFVGAFPKVPWKDVAGMRHRLIHGYMSVNLHAVWLAASRDVPELLAEVESILRVGGRP